MKLTKTFNVKKNSSHDDDIRNKKSNIIAIYFNYRNSILNSMRNNVKAKFGCFPERIKSMSVEKIANTSIIDSGLSSKLFNSALGGTVTKDMATRVMEYYKNKPMFWWIIGSDHRNRRILLNTGFVYEELCISMVCDINSIPEKYITPTGFEVKKCKTKKDFKDFSDVFSAVYNSYDPDGNQIKRYYDKVADIDPKERLGLVSFVGYSNGQPVSTASLFLTDVAGIYDVSTKPEARKKGFGSAIFHRMLMKAKRKGINICCIQSTLAGFRVYKSRFGFKKISDCNLWSNKAGSV